MAVQLNHTIVHAYDHNESATFYADILGLAAPTTYGPFREVRLQNDVALDFMKVDEVLQQHYAFLVSEEEFDEIQSRIVARELEYWADPFEKRPGEINHDDGGRGLYWLDPSGHKLEIITVPYGGWPA